MQEAGKGSRERPVLDRDQFDKNWDRIFGGASSPCIDVCRLDFARGVCLGCYRTMNEIAAWGNCSDDERGRILKNIEERKQHAKDCNDGPAAADGFVD